MSLAFQKALASLIRACKTPGALYSDGSGGVTLASSLLGAIPSISSWAALPTLGASDRAIASLPRLCAHGMCLVMWNGTRWGVVPGQVVISDAGTGSSTDGYDLTAAGTSFVSLVSYTIPAGMFGDGEEWFATAHMRNNGVYVSGTDTVQVRWQSLGANGTIISAAGANLANRVARGEGRMLRLGSTLVRMAGRSDAGSVLGWNGQNSADQTLDLSVAQTIEAGITPGAATNTSRIRHWTVGRFA